MKPIVHMALRHLMRRMMSRGGTAGTRHTGGHGARKGGAFNARRAQQGIRLLRRFLRSR